MTKVESKKTIISGPADYTPGNGGEGVYGRSETPVNGRTYIPYAYNQSAVKNGNDGDTVKEKKIHLQNRVIAGVLYSVSHLYSGEIFPVYMGRNTIGSDKGCDICLKEESVSPQHAVLLIRNVENDEGQIGITASITDYDSEYGTKVGDESLGFDKKACQDHDIISLGNSYKLLLCLFDTTAYGLSVDGDFRQLWTEDDIPAKEPEVGHIPPYQQEMVDEVMAGSESIPDFYKPSRKSKRKQQAQANETIVNKVIRK